VTGDVSEVKFTTDVVQHSGMHHHIGCPVQSCSYSPDRWNESQAEGIRLERQRIYMTLVDRLWTCDSDANAVLDIVENPEDDDLPDYVDDEYNGRIPGR